MQGSRHERGMFSPGPGSSDPVYPGKQFLKDSPKYQFAGKTYFENGKPLLNSHAALVIEEKRRE